MIVSATDEGGRMGQGDSARRRGERGESKLGCIFWTAALVVGVIVAWVAVPVKVKSSELHDFMIDQATNAAHVRSAAALEKRVLTRAKELDLPLTAKNLTVQRTEARVKMNAEYTVTLEFPFGITYDWDFRHVVDRPIFFY